MSQNKPTNGMILRTFCSASQCKVWEAIEATDVDDQKNILRDHCKQKCKAYEYSKWLDLTNRRFE